MSAEHLRWKFIKENSEILKLPFFLVVSVFSVFFLEYYFFSWSKAWFLSFSLNLSIINSHLFWMYTAKCPQNIRLSAVNCVTDIKMNKWGHLGIEDHELNSELNSASRRNKNLDNLVGPAVLGVDQNQGVGRHQAALAARDLDALKLQRIYGVGVNVNESGVFFCHEQRSRGFILGWELPFF